MPDNCRVAQSGRKPSPPPVLTASNLSAVRRSGTRTPEAVDGHGQFLHAPGMASLCRPPVLMETSPIRIALLGGAIKMLARDLAAVSSPSLCACRRRERTVCA
jgi:hypothetical protein